MNTDFSHRSRLIAKNTILLYFRMFFLMLINVYTSRVVLGALGVQDYGIYNVVGGVISMFTILSGSTTAAVSRFITYELGKNHDLSGVRTVFSTSVSVMLILGLIIVVLSEPVGIWFIECRMNVPAERIFAARWVFQFSLLTFLVNLISVPYNSLIIAKEKMSAYAYISIFEGVAKLAVAYLILRSPIDRLIFYAILSCMLALSVRMAYVLYCRFTFDEVKGKLVLDRLRFKEMFGFAGWNFIGSSVYVINTQGVNLLSNVFFGVAVNAARGVVGQVESAVSQFVNNFTTAINPQITKSYAAGDRDYMFSLICNGARYSYFMMLFFAVPIVIESDTILDIWLKDVPEYASVFLKLSMACSLCTVLSNTLVTALFAQGDIKHYQIVVGTIGAAVFPVCYLLFKIGCPPYVSYLVYFTIYAVILFVRLFLLKNKIGMPVQMYVKGVLTRVVMVTLPAFAIPYATTCFMDSSVLRLIIVIGVSWLAIAFTVWLSGITKEEKNIVIHRIKTINRHS